MPDAPRAFILICSATALRQQFYWKFAEWMTTQGYGVLTFDYRGIGASLNGRSVRDSSARKQDWGQLDMPAALDYLVCKFPDLPIHLVGHSVGGQLIGLMPNHERLERIVTVGSSSGYLYNLASGIRLFAAFLLKVYIPISAKLLGYVPTRWIGWGEDLPAQVALQWAAWCTRPGYVLNALGSDVTVDFFDQIKGPILWLTATDDPIATPENIDDMLRLYENASVTRGRINPREYGLERIGHVDFFRARNAKLWPLIADWLSPKSLNESKFGAIKDTLRLSESRPTR
ncbi:MAG: alpha/beta fold hydrolase [Gammaproteobacteria bacterium]